MKLREKYNRVNIIATIIALFVSGICYYFFIRYQLINQLDQDLKIEELETIDYVALHNSLPRGSSYKDQAISFQPADDHTVKRQFTSENMFSPQEKRWQPVRKLVFPIRVTGKVYKVLISKSQQETNDLIQLILLITLTIVVALLIVLFFINRFLLNKLWMPFNTTLQQLKEFNLAGTNKLQPQKTSINEFNDLNNAVAIMSNRVTQDYEALKDFTENASHEIQTPLAIIQSKLELLMQSDNLPKEQVRHIQSMYDACVRLSKLNQSLVLLTKIDNQQFRQKELVYPAKIICRLLGNYEDLLAVKQIKINTSMDDDCKITMNDIMAELLFSNLIINAIKHNIEKGRIEITLTGKELVVCNTGHALASEPAELFGRFKKDNQHSGSLGLGLSIVKKICEQNNFTVGYHFHDAIHAVNIQFY